MGSRINPYLAMMQGRALVMINKRISLAPVWGFEGKKYVEIPRKQMRKLMTYEQGRDALGHFTKLSGEVTGRVAPLRRK